MIPCKLRDLCAAAVIRDNIDCANHTISLSGKLLTEIQTEFDQNSTLQNRLSGCTIKLLASYDKSSEIWRDPKVTMWFACCDDLDVVEHVSLSSSDDTQLMHIQNCFLGSLTKTSANRCLEFACKVILRITSNPHVSVLDWILDDQVCAPRFEVISLTKATLSLGSVVDMIV